jgi:hypothetical protein
VTEDEYGVKYRNGRRIRWRAAAGSGKSAGHFLNCETLLFKDLRRFGKP